MSCPSCASVSLTCPWPCARAVPGCVWPTALGLAAPWPLTVATGLAPGIAVETAWPRIICVTTCCPPWPRDRSVYKSQYWWMDMSASTDPTKIINYSICPTERPKHFLPCCTTSGVWITAFPIAPVCWIGVRITVIPGRIWPPART